jgi:hypothetical protein
VRCAWQRLSKIAYPVDKHTVALPQIINANSKPTTASTKLTPQHLSNTGHIPFFTLAMIPKNKMSHLQLFHLNYSVIMRSAPRNQATPLARLLRHFFHAFHTDSKHKNPARCHI